MSPDGKKKAGWRESIFSQLPCQMLQVNRISHGLSAPTTREISPATTEIYAFRYSSVSPLSQMPKGIEPNQFELYIG